MSKDTGKLKIYTAKRILTMDPGRPFATAIAINGDKIVSVGTLESLKPYMDRHPYEIDDSFQDNILMPGFIDSHTHMRFSGVYMMMYYVGPIESYGAKGGTNDPCLTRDDVLDRLRDIVSKQEDPNQPVLCWGYDPAKHDGHLDRDMLDKISDTTPIWVVCYAPHIIYTNSPMLKMIGVEEDTQEFGIGRYPDGRLNGWFVETSACTKAMAPLQDIISPAGSGEAAIRMHADACISGGVTATADMGWGFTSGLEAEWNDHEKVVNEPNFPLRVSLVPFAPSLEQQLGDKRWDYLEEKYSKATSRITPHGMKWLGDGSYPAMTSMLNYPGYLDEDTGSKQDIPWEDMIETMLPYWERGYRIHLHSNGDATTDMALDTLAGLLERKPRFDHRFTIEHYTISNPEQAYRLATLGGAASVNAYFAHYRPLLHSVHGYGPDRAEATARLGSLARAGARFCIHADFNMVVVPMKPLEGAWIAVNRLAEDDKTVVAPGERISVEQALRAITIDSAWMIDREKELGSLEPGKFADMAILAEDPLEVDPMKLRDIEVLGTISGGVVHMAKE